ncbi:MAG: PIN domain-containing protein [Anaeromyxobacteraceae bacterium]
MGFVVVYDACVLYPAALRDLLVRLAASGLYQTRWTARILDECFESIVEARPELAGKLDRTRSLMEAAIPAAMVTGYEPLVPTVTLPDEDDRHVLAAAIRCGAQVIVTTNLRDFPTEALAPWEVEAQHPDAFVLHLLSLDPGAVVRAVTAQAAGLKAPPVTVAELLSILEARGLVQAVGQLRRLM